MPRPRDLARELDRGVEVVDERPYELEGLARPTYIYEFGLRYGQAMPAHSRKLFQDALRAVWDGYNEIDGFNALVLSAGLTWRQATVLRAYAKYMRQGNSPFALDYIEDALRNNVDITRLLVQLFEARFDPGSTNLAADAEARTARVEEIEGRIGRALDDVASLDEDRILRRFLHLRILAAEEVRLYALVLDPVQHLAHRRITVSSRSPCLLVVRFDGAGEMVVDHPA